MRGAGLAVTAAAAFATCAGLSAADAGTRAAVRCSASGLPQPRSVQGLPPVVARLRLEIAAAARRCDFAELERLANVRGRGLRFSFGIERGAAAYWRRLERTGPRPRPMEALVKILDLPFVRDETGSYAWPSAHRRNPRARDWQALRTLYSPVQIERMRRAGIGYLGYRAGITRRGDWQYFVAGD